MSLREVSNPYAKGKAACAEHVDDAKIREAHIEADAL